MIEPSAASAVAMPSAILILRLESERGSPMTFEVTPAGATLGRAPESTIRLDDLSVSRKQSRIAYREGAYWLSDLGSMGGTWVDGTKLNAPKRLAAGQVIDIGVCRLTVAAAPHAEPSASRTRQPR
jgi:pSer/pThr/pTyr-binding forkhead associated (FHA) protein